MNRNIRRVEKQVGEYTFLVPLLGVREQRKILFKVAGVMGVPLADLVDSELGESAGTEDATEGFDAMLKGLKSAFVALQDERTLDVYEWLLDSFSKDNRAKVQYFKDGNDYEPFLCDVYDEFFHMQLDLEAQFLWCCMEANFAPFTERVRNKLKLVFAKIANAKKNAKEELDEKKKDPENET